MRKWSFTFIAMSFLAGMLTGCRSFCHTAGVCDCDFAMDDPCCHRAPWVSGPCLPNYDPTANLKGGCASGNCGRGGCIGGGCGNGACAKGNCASGSCATGNCANGACSGVAAVGTSGNVVAGVVRTGGTTTSAPVASPYPSNQNNAPPKSLVQMFRQKFAKNSTPAPEYSTVNGPTNGKEIIAITPPVHASNGNIPTNSFPVTTPVPSTALPGGSSSPLMQTSGDSLR